MLLGGLVVPHPLVERLSAALAKSRLPELPDNEMRWTKVSRSKLGAYKRYVAELLHPGRWPIDFHCLVIDTAKIKDRKYNFGSREIGFNKEIYQLLLRAWRRRRNRNFHAYLDHRYVTKESDPNIQNEVSLNKLRSVVNSGIRQIEPDLPYPMRRIHWRDSSSCCFLQATDILMGAVAFRANGHDKAENASPHKIELAQHIMDLAGVRDPLTDSSGKLSIWWRQLQ